MSWKVCGRVDTGVFFLLLQGSCPTKCTFLKISVNKDMGKLLVVMENDAATLEKSLGSPQNVKHRINI